MNESIVVSLKPRMPRLAPLGNAEQTLHIERKRRNCSNFERQGFKFDEKVLSACRSNACSENSSRSSSNGCEVQKWVCHQSVQTVQQQNSVEAVSVRALASKPVENSPTCPQRTISVLCVAVLVIWFAAATGYKDLIANCSAPVWGLIAAIFLFCVFATVQFPDGVLVRPHPAWWRFIKGASVLYLLLVCFLLFQTPEDVRRWLRAIDPDLSQPFIEKEYAADCRIFSWENPNKPLANVIDKLDIFVLAHFLGWTVKALVIRDWRMLWIMSVLFEWMEITFRHVLPNFWECWWDHLILDIFGCNAAGIVLGLTLQNWLGFKQYLWQWARHKPPKEEGQSIEIVSAAEDSPPANKAHSKVINTLPNVSRGKLAPLKWVISSFSPSQWTIYKWPNMFDSLEAFSGLIFFVLGVTFLDLNLFFLKAELWLQVDSWPLKLRTFLFVNIAAAGTRDFYEYVTNPEVRRIGLQGWLGTAIIMTETLTALQYREALGAPLPCPMYVKVVWLLLVTVVLTTGVYVYVTKNRRRKRVKIRNKLE